MASVISGDANVSATEFGYLDGVTAGLQSQLDAKLPLAGGKILQIVRAVLASGTTTTSTSLVDVTGMSVTITPQANTSAIFIVATGQMSANATTGGNLYGRIGIADSSNNPVSGGETGYMGNQNFSYTGTGSFLGYYNLIGYSTPATTSATTYKLRFRVDSATTTLSVQPFGSTSQMIAIEVSA